MSDEVYECSVEDLFGRECDGKRVWEWIGARGCDGSLKVSDIRTYVSNSLFHSCF